MKLTMLPLVLLAGFAASRVVQPTITIDASSPRHVSPLFYGLMTEEINHAYDGGLYAELIQNRAFLDSTQSPVHWSVVQDGGASAIIALDTSDPPTAAIPTSLRLEVTEPASAGQQTVRSAAAAPSAGVANDGYWGIPIRPRTRYRVSFYARAAPGTTGPVTVSLESTDRRVKYATAAVSGLTSAWRQYEATLETRETPVTADARFALTLNRPGKVWLSLVSLFPPTFQNQPNGFRPDLMQMLVDMKPKFLRFPGGNYLEGDQIGDRFDWKKTLGPLAERPGHMAPWTYRSSDGLGLYEFLLWCEDMHAEPVLAVYAGYSLKGAHVNPGPELQPYVQDALDEIEYVAGPPTSTWGAVRAKAGHPAPFTMHYVEIGNEDFFDRSGSYDERFTQFNAAIKARYPQLKVISTVGFEHPENQRVRRVRPDVVDEHYYLPVNEFLSAARGKYETYDRQGPEVFVGEWGSYETPFQPWDARSRSEPPTPNMQAAIGDAAWMTEMERNSDLVVMNCFAPLLVNVSPGARQWRPDLIGYDALRVYGSPSYHAIKLFSTHVGDELLTAAASDTPVLASATRDSKSHTIFVKLVNPGDGEATVTVELKSVGAVAPTATAITIAAPSDATNSIDAPERVAPVTSKITGVGASFAYRVPAHGIVALLLESR